MFKIGRHIVVYGPTGSGKTTVAAHLARRIGVPHIELDAVFWLPQWNQKPVEEFRADVSTLLSECTDGWVFDGNYSRHVTSFCPWLILSSGSAHLFSSPSGGS